MSPSKNIVRRTETQRWKNRARHRENWRERLKLSTVR